MAYTTSNSPSFVSDGLGAIQPRIWSYSSADDSATIDGAGYITNARALGMAAGDLFLARNTSTGALTTHSVLSIGTSGAANLSSSSSGGSGSGTATVTLEEFNTSAGNSSTQDDGPAFRSAILTGRPIELDGSKTYYVGTTTDPLDSSNGSLLYVASRDFVLNGNGATIVSQANKTTLQISQTIATDYNVSAITTVTHQFESSGLNSRCTRLTLSTAVLGAFADFAVGDVVKIASEDIITGMATYKMGEFAVIGEIDSGSSYLYLTGVCSELFATSIRVGRLLRKKVEISNVKFNHDDAGLAGNWTASHIWHKGCVEPTFDQVEVIRSFGHGIIDNSAYLANYTRCKLRNCIPSNGVGYGIFMQCSKGTNIGFSEFFNCRHGTTNNPRSPASDDFFFRRGRCFNFNVHNSFADACRNAGFDMHGDAKGCRFVNLTITGSFLGPASIGCGLQVAGDDCTADNIRVYNCTNGIQILNRNTDSTPGVGLGIKITNPDIEVSDRAVIITNSNTGDTNDVQAEIYGGRLSGGAALSSDMIQITRSQLTLYGTRLQPTGQSGGNVVRIPSRGKYVARRCNEDLSLAAGTWQPVTFTTIADSEAYIDYIEVDISADVGDAGATFTATARTPRVVYANTAFTANRTVTLPTYAMPPIKFVRGAGATGASTWSIGGLKTLAVSEMGSVANPGGVNGPAWIYTGKEIT